MDLIKRQFVLKNNKNVAFNLLGNTNNTPWLYQPNGLGFEKQIETATVLNRRIITKIENKFPDISGTMFFKSYAEYMDFEAYIESSQTNVDMENPKNYLKLYYQTTNNNDLGYYLVYVDSLEKEEKDTDGLLFCKINFKRLSNYLIDKVITISNELPLENFPTFPLGVHVPFIKFGSGFSSLLTFNINNTSYLEIPVRFEINGGFANPTFINETNGYDGGYDVTSTNGKLIVEANTPQYIFNGGVSVAESQDFTKTNFLILSPGNNKVVFNLGQVSSFGAVTIYYTEERLSV